MWSTLHIQSDERAQWSLYKNVFGFQQRMVSEGAVWLGTDMNWLLWMHGCPMLNIQWVRQSVWWRWRQLWKIQCIVVCWCFSDDCATIDVWRWSDGERRWHWRRIWVVVSQAASWFHIHDAQHVSAGSARLGTRHLVSVVETGAAQPQPATCGTAMWTGRCQTTQSRVIR